MRVFKTRAFGRFARKARIGDAQLCEAIERAERGVIDADLGGHVIKQRVARPGRGRSGGYRTLIAHHAGTRAVFLFGFAKNAQENIMASDLDDLRRAARSYMALSGVEIKEAITGGKLTEVDCES